jgi:hypothetical protein
MKEYNVGVAGYPSMMVTKLREAVCTHEIVLAAMEPEARGCPIRLDEISGG